MRLEVDVDSCIGTGQCVLTAPELFDQDEDDGTVVLLREAVEPHLEESARSAVGLCPARAIDLLDN